MPSRETTTGSNTSLKPASSPSEMSLPATSDETQRISSLPITNVPQFVPVTPEVSTMSAVGSRSDNVEDNNANINQTRPGLSYGKLFSPVNEFGSQPSRKSRNSLSQLPTIKLEWNRASRY